MSCITEILKLKGDKEFLRIGDENSRGHLAIEGGGLYKGYEYLITFVRTHRCGYVALPSDHPYNEYDETYDMPIDCHGGVTFCSKEHSAKNFLNIPCEDVWVGFDACHSGDLNDMATHKKYFGETDYFKFKQEYPDVLYYDFCQSIRSYEYMEQECKNVINQLIEAKEAA